MKKKIATYVLIGVFCLTALVLLCGFSSPIFYDTEYSIHYRGVYSGSSYSRDYQHVIFKNDGTLKFSYTRGELEYEETGSYTIVGNVLFIDSINKNNMLTITNKFSLNKGNYYLSPSGGGTLCALIIN